MGVNSVVREWQLFKNYVIFLKAFDCLHISMKQRSKAHNAQQHTYKREAIKK